MDIVVAVDDPRADDVRALLEQHLAFAREVTPPGHVHALEVESLLRPTITLFSVRGDGVLLGVGALSRVDDTHAELKSMHTSEAARGLGVGRAIVDHILAFATEQNYERVSLETGTMAAFTPARSLYSKVGFVPCEPFGDYTDNPHSICMTIELRGGRMLRP
jgi:putative acetyltransferase